MSELKYGIAWNDEFKLGYEQVDEQHKRLFELLNTLVSQCIDGSNADKLKETLDFLVDYTVHHFYDEESLQVQFMFPDYKRHKKLHDDFKETVTSLVRRFTESGSSEILSSDVNRIIVRWLVGHIRQEDKKIGDHIRKVTARTVSA